jgi:hypothetical protein
MIQSIQVKSNWKLLLLRQVVDINLLRRVASRIEAIRDRPPPDLDHALCTTTVLERVNFYLK